MPSSFDAILSDRLPAVADAVVPLSRGGRLILLLDGFNELPTARPPDKVGDIRRLIAALDRPTQLFVFCRADDHQGSLELGLDALSLQAPTLQQSRAQQGEVRAPRLF